MSMINTVYTRTPLLALVLLFSIASAVMANQQRIISTDASVTELLFSFDAQTDLIAVDVTSQLPADFRPLPNIGYHRNLSAEGLLSLQPSLVIGSELMGPASVIDALNKANIPLVRLRSAETLDDLKENINTISTLLRHSHKGDSLQRAIDQKVSLIQTLSFKNERIAFLLSINPNKLSIAGKGTSGDAFINLLGAKNVGDFENYRNVSAESLLAMEPTVILVAGRTQASSVDELLASQNILKLSAAGKADRIISVDGRAFIAGLSVSAIDEAVRVADRLHKNQALTQ